MSHLASYMRLSFPIILLLAFGLAAESLAGDVVKMDPGLMGPGKGVIQQQAKPMNFPPGSFKKMPPAGSQKSGGLKLPSTWDYINTFGRAGADALGTVRGWRRGGGGRTWRPGSGRGWTQQYGDQDWRYVYPEEHVTPEYHPAPLPPNPVPSAAPRLAPNSLPGQARVPGQIKPIDKAFLNFVGGAIVNPADSESELNYMLNGRPFTLPPGHYQDLGIDRQWVIRFDRGGPFGAAEYSIGGVKHSFTPTQKGWELFSD